MYHALRHHVVGVLEEFFEVRLFPMHIQGCGVGVNFVEEKRIGIVLRLQNMKEMAVRLVTHGCLGVGEDANPLDKITSAIHVYGGDFFDTPRSEWDPETFEEHPYDVEHTMRVFDESNKHLQEATQE